MDGRASEHKVGCAGCDVRTGRLACKHHLPTPVRKVCCSPTWTHMLRSTVNPPRLLLRHLLNQRRQNQGCHHGCHNVCDESSECPWLRPDLLLRVLGLEVCLHWIRPINLALRGAVGSKHMIVFVMTLTLAKQPTVRHHRWRLSAIAEVPWKTNKSSSTGVWAQASCTGRILFQRYLRKAGFAHLQPVKPGYSHRLSIEMICAARRGRRMNVERFP